MKSEAETRKELIDKKLNDAGWDVNNLAQVAKEFDISVSLPDGVAEARTIYTQPWHNLNILRIYKFKETSHLRYPAIRYKFSLWR